MPPVSACSKKIKKYLTHANSLNLTPVIFSTKTCISLSDTSCIYLHTSDLYLCHYSFSRDRKHFTFCFYLTLSNNPSTYQPTAAVTRPLLTSLCPFRSVWQYPSLGESWKQQGTGGRTEIALGFSNSVSFSISIPSNLHLSSLMRLLHPCSSLFFPLNPSFLFACLYAHICSSSLSLSVLCFASVPHSSSAYLPWLCFPHFSCFCCIHYVIFFSSPGRSHEECNKVPQFLKDQACCTVGLCV